MNMDTIEAVSYIFVHAYFHPLNLLESVNSVYLTSVQTKTILSNLHGFKIFPTEKKNVIGLLDAYLNFILSKFYLRNKL